MAEENNKQKRNIFQKLRNKYRLIIYNDDTFEEVWYMRLSRLNVIAFFGTGIIILIALVSILIAFTSLKEFIPGYPKGDVRVHIARNHHRIDSLEQEIAIRNKYLSNLKNIISGETPQDRIHKKDTTASQQEVSFERSRHDSILRKQIEEKEQYALSIDYQEPKDRALSQIHFFAPVEGIITNSFSPKTNHFGTDIVAGSNKVVVASLDGTVTLADWTLKTGYIIQIQHKNNIITVYKHNAELLKEVGDHVKAGDAIAIVGNSGELTSGPHLHFELWQNGTPLDPEKYIIF
jgi:murein DD-endopeptidase MepM/ murein hydrolase activator NlpD